MSRLAWFGCPLLVGLLLAPGSGRAQCIVTGTGIVRDVSPVGTTLRFGVSEQARVLLDGTRAHVQGITPIAFEGDARSFDVELSTERSRRLLGVVQADAGTPLRVTRVRGTRASARIDAGPTRFWVELPCDALALGDVPRDEAAAPASPPVEGAGEVRLRGDVLRAYPSARGGTAVVMRLRAGGERGWPDLQVLEARGGRVHVRAPLEIGLVLDAWVARESVGPVSRVLTGCGCDELGASGCGHGYASETYRGPAHLARGTELLDDGGVVWGRLVMDADVEIAVSAVTITWSSEGGETTRHVTETVWIERLPGVITNPCASLRIQVDRAAVTLP